MFTNGDQPRCLKIRCLGACQCRRVSQVVARSRHRLDILCVSRAASQGRQGVGCQNGEERGPEASGWEDLSTLFRIRALQDTGFPRLFEFATSITYFFYTSSMRSGYNCRRVSCGSRSTRIGRRSGPDRCGGVAQSPGGSRGTDRDSWSLIRPNRHLGSMLV
jgi:hypothetical protein